MGIVDASELTETVILIRRRQAVARHRSDIAHIVVCIREILPILRDARDQRRGEDGVLRVRVKVGVLSGVVRCADSHAPVQPADRIIGIGQLAVVCTEAKLRRLVLDIVGVGRLVAGAVVHLLLEGSHVTKLVVAQRARVLRCTGGGAGHTFHQVRADRTLARVVLRPHRVPQLGVLHIRSLPVRAVIVGEARFGRIVIVDARHAAEVVARVMHLAAVAVFHAHQRAITRVRIHIGGKNLIAHLHGRRIAKLIIIEGIRHIRRIAGRIMCHRFQAIFFISVSILIISSVRRRARSNHAHTAIIGIIDALPIRISYLGQRILRQIGFVCHDLTARIRLGRNVVAVRRITLVGIHHAGAIHRVDDIRPHEIAVRIVSVCRPNTRRRINSERQPLLLFRIAAAVGNRRLDRIGATRLHIADQVVVIIVLRLGFLSNKVFHRRHIAVIVVGERVAEFLFVERHAVEIRIVDVLLIIHIETNTRISARGNDRSGDILPVRPFLVPIQNFAILIRAGAVLKRNANTKMTLIITNRAREALCPAASNINVALTAAKRQILINPLIGLRITVQTHAIIRQEGRMQRVCIRHNRIFGCIYAVCRPERRDAAAV